MPDINEKKRVTPVAQEPHSAEDCKINESPHNHPDVDCGHFVPTGPATGMVYNDDGEIVPSGEDNGPGVE